MEIIPNVHRIPGVRGANLYLLLDSEMTLVDAGMPASAEAICNYIQYLGLSPCDLARVVVTHDHLDHVGSLSALKQDTSAQVLAHPADAQYISGQATPPPVSSGVMRLLLRLVAPLMPQPEPVAVDGLLQDGDHLDLLGGATVVHLPGHTPGSIGLHFPSERLLICGDTIDHRRQRLRPPPKLFSADMDQALASLRRMAELEFDVLCPGHGDPIVGGAGDRVRAMVQALP
jgi:glyoxylase-like metal-dependent hydrolase (beta-lactamase superfamily II)